MCLMNWVFNVLLEVVTTASIQTWGAAKKEPRLTHFRLYMAATEPATVTLSGNMAGVEMVLRVVPRPSTPQAEIPFSCSLESSSLGVLTGNLC